MVSNGIYGHTVIGRILQLRTSVGNVNALMSIEHFGPAATTIGGGFFVGILIGYALKKVIKILAIVIGLFFVGIVYLKYQQILSINWNKLQTTSQHASTMLRDATTQISNHINNITDSSGHATNTLVISNLGIPLTSSIAMGFAVGFMKG